MSFPTFVKFLVIIVSNAFFTLFSPSFLSSTPITCMLDLLILALFKSHFPLYFSDWISPIHLSSSSLALYTVVSSLLLNPCSRNFVSVLYFSVLEFHLKAYFSTEITYFFIHYKFKKYTFFPFHH